MENVTSFWWNSVTNWGDRLTPLLLNKFSRLKIDWAPVELAEIVCVGSILGNLVKPNYTGTILGSGKLFPNGLVPQKANILALRGPLTAKGVKGDFAIGDPGLLADELVNVDKKLYNLGIVLHWSDHSLEHDPRFLKYDPIIIRSDGDPLTTIHTIGSCKKIISSSLHGLILADAFNIPRRFEATADWSREGGNFKVMDHNASIGLSFEIGLTQQANFNKIIERKNELWCAFQMFNDLRNQK